MKFVKACMVASLSGYAAHASDCFLSSVGAGDMCAIVDTVSSGVMKDTTFFKNMLKNMQKDSANKNSDCMKGFD